MPTANEETITLRYRETPSRASEINAPGVPEARYQCENESAGISAGEPHYRESGFPASELRFARFHVPQHETIYGGFWCASCLEKLGIKPKGATLKEYLEHRMSARITEAARQELAAWL